MITMIEEELPKKACKKHWHRVAKVYSDTFPKCVPYYIKRGYVMLVYVTSRAGGLMESVNNTWVATGTPDTNEIIDMVLDQGSMDISEDWWVMFVPKMEVVPYVKGGLF